jgi:hypothetical protein
MENVEAVMDYAHPIIQATAALKALQNAALGRDFDLAEKEALQAIVEIRLALAAIRNMKETSKW